MSVLMIPEGFENVAGTTVMGWTGQGYMDDTGTDGSSSRWPSNITPLYLTIPNWPATQKYALSYS